MGSRNFESQSESVDFEQQDGGDDMLLRDAFSSLSAAATTGEVDRVLFNNLVEMVPLVQSLIDKKANSSFTRRGSMIYTKTPSREPLYKKTAGKSANRKNRDTEANNQDDENYSSLSSKGLNYEKDRQELLALRDQVEELKRQLSEKDELLKSAELLNEEMASIHTKYDDLVDEVVRKESAIKSAQLQLSDTKIKLADKQAAAEKLEWEAMTSKKEVEKLKKDLDSAQDEITYFMSLIRGLTRDHYDIYPEDDMPSLFDQSCILEFEIDQQKLEEAREAYIAAVMTAKENQDEESIAAAANARFYLQSIVLKQS